MCHPRCLLALAVSLGVVPWLVGAGSGGGHAIYPGDTVVVGGEGAVLMAPGSPRRVLAPGTRVKVTEARGTSFGVAVEIDGERTLGWLPMESLVLELDPPDAAAAPAAGADDGPSRERLVAAGVRLQRDVEGATIAADASASTLDDRGAAALAGLPALRRLDLSGRPLGAVALASLGALTGLRELYLDGCPVGDAELELVARAKGLEVLTLARTRVTGRGLATVAGLSQLRTLNLARCAVDDQALARLGPLAELEVLVLAGTEVRGPGLVHLSRLPRLRVLNLEGCRLDGGAVATLDRIPSLRLLYLARTATPAEALDHLRRRNPILSIDSWTPLPGAGNDPGGAS